VVEMRRARRVLDLEAGNEAARELLTTLGG
jgi:hypothetical protein